MSGENTSTRQRHKQNFKIDTPKKYNVVMHNDDITTMDFVIEVLITIFYKSESDAETLMLKVHTEGSAIVGTYDYDIASSKVGKVKRLATENGFPLRTTVEPA